MSNFLSSLIDQKSSQKLRLDRLIVVRGLASRKEAQRLIRRGHVMVDDVLLTDPKIKVKDDIHIQVNGEVSRPLPCLLAFHKPLGMVSTFKDPWGRQGLDHVLPQAWRTTFHPVGRLDADTSGLLLFSSQGQVTQRLLHPKYQTPRMYWALINDHPSTLAQQLQQGVATALGTFQAQLQTQLYREVSDVWPISTHEPWLDSFPTQWIHPQQESLYPILEQAQHAVLLSVTEGKNRMVRRMLHNAGASVLALHRISFADIMLKDLPVGETRVVDV